MADTLETLEIQIQHSSTGAAAEIRKVADAIRSVGTALGKVLPQMREFNQLMGNRRRLNFTDNSTTNQISQVADTINNTQNISKSAGRATQDVAKGVTNVGKAAQKAATPLGNFLSALKRIAMYRLLRSIIKAITQAFTEGLEKAYLFSSSISTDGHRFAAAMDTMKSATNQMKGQLGSAFISLLAAIQPILLTLINLVIKAADAISQFFAAFTGKTYLKATATAAKFADTMKAGGAAAKEWKNQLLGFDEINRLNEPSNGGGGGGGTDPMAGYDFEDTPINSKLLELIEKLQPAIDRLKEAWGRLTEAWGRFKESMQDGVLNKIVEDIFILCGDAVINALTILTDTLTAIVNVLTALNTGDWTTVWESLKKVVDDVWQALWDLIFDILIPLFDALSLVYPPAGEFADQLRAIKDGTAEVVTVLDDGTEELYTMADAAADAAAKMDGTYTPAINNAGGAVSSFWDDLKLFGADVSALFSSLIAPIVDFCVWIDSAIQGLGFFKGLGGNLNIAGNINAPTFASGGFPDEGQLFFANEAGAELVGSMNGRTAVANNQEITEGIRQAVYDAFTAANGNSNQDISVKVYLDSREIKAGQERLARAWG